MVCIWRSKAHKAGAFIQLVSSAVLFEPHHTVGHRILEQVLNLSVPGREEGQEDIQHQKHNDVPALAIQHSEKHGVTEDQMLIVFEAGNLCLDPLDGVGDDSLRLLARKPCRGTEELCSPCLIVLKDDVTILSPGLRDVHQVSMKETTGSNTSGRQR